MYVKDIFLIYEYECKQKPESINHVLDFYQRKYITGVINIKQYKTIYYYLHKQGAVSAHEYV